MKPTARGAVFSGPVSTSAMDGAAPLTVDLITDHQGLLDLEPVWNRLVDEAGIDHPFLHHEWVRIWWDCFGKGRRPHVLVAKAGSEPIAIAPLMLGKGRVHGVPLRQLEFIWNVYGERCDFIVGRRPTEAYRAVWSYLLNRKDLWDVLRLPQLPDGSRSLEELPRLAEEHGFLVGLWRSGRSPYLPLSGGWESFLEALDSKHRSNLRNRLKRLSQLGQVSLEVVSTAERLGDALDDGFRIEAAAWKGRAGTAIQARPDVRRFYTQLAEVAARRGWLHLCFLTVAGRRIAFGYFLLYANKLYLLKPGYDPRFAPYSPSVLLCYLVLRDAFARGIAELDFLAAADPWKLEWTATVRPHYWLYVFSHRLTPRLLHWTKFRLLPRLKQQPVVRALVGAALRRWQGARHVT